MERAVPRQSRTMKMEPALRVLLSAGMIYAGVNHFINPKPFISIVPAFLPWHAGLVSASGFFEVAGGVGLFVPKVSRSAAWGLIALYIAVFPANINMAINNLPISDHHFPKVLLWLRLPLQLVLIAWAYRYTKDRNIQ